jgi:plasmid maintenance system antidote protein VapI
VADTLGISRQMVGFLENGEREFTPDMALLIEEKLGIDRADILPKLFKRVA